MDSAAASPSSSTYSLPGLRLSDSQQLTYELLTRLEQLSEDENERRHALDLLRDEVVAKSLRAPNSDTFLHQVACELLEREVTLAEVRQMAVPLPRDAEAAHARRWILGHAARALQQMQLRPSDSFSALTAPRPRNGSTDAHGSTRLRAEGGGGEHQSLSRSSVPLREGLATPNTLYSTPRRSYAQAVLPSSGHKTLQPEGQMMNGRTTDLEGCSPLRWLSEVRGVTDARSARLSLKHLLSCPVLRSPLHDPVYDVRRSCTIEREVSETEGQGGLAYKRYRTDCVLRDMVEIFREHGHGPLQQLWSQLEAALCCPIDLDVFEQPYIDPEGHVFNASSIASALQRLPLCPLSRAPLTDLDLHPHRTVEAAVSWLRRTAELGLVQVAAEAAYTGSAGSLTTP